MLASIVRQLYSESPGTTLEQSRLNPVGTIKLLPAVSENHKKYMEVYTGWKWLRWSWTSTDSIVRIDTEWWAGEKALTELKSEAINWRRKTRFGKKDIVVEAIDQGVVGDGGGEKKMVKMPFTELWTPVSCLDSPQKATRLDFISTTQLPGWIRQAFMSFNIIAWFPSRRHCKMRFSEDRRYPLLRLYANGSYSCGEEPCRDEREDWT